MENIVVFGATGTVGAYTCLYLAEHGYHVMAVGGRKSDNGFFADFGIDYYSVDVRDARSFESLPTSDVSAVVNLAGILPARMEGYQPQKYIDVNMTGALNILNYCVKANAERVIYSQSISDVAQLCGTDTPISSDAPTGFPLNNDHSVYSITKNAAVALLIHYSAKYLLKFYILRFPNIYLYHPNPYYYVDGESRWQGYRLMIHKAIHGEPIEIWGNPARKRDIVYVKDCCQIIERCIAVKSAGSGTYNVGTGIGVTLEEQVKGIVDVFSPKGCPSPILYNSSKPDASEYVFDMSKTEEILGYKSQYDYLGYLEDFKKEMEAQRFEKLWGRDLLEKIDKKDENRF
ncbi:MAG: NAD(P)-dependent oxidoreductase [Bacteroidaceae bacterium]|nr:NAD(P)-dependent oxidoreductase [Bacteroidaceae bacterium]